jgi:hypothetical protein
VFVSPVGRTATAILLASLLAGCAGARGGAPRCNMPPATRSWIGQSLEAWDDVREHALRLPPRPPPRLMFFDRTCVFTLSPFIAGPALIISGSDTLRFRAGAHGGRVALPNGRSLPVRAEAFASLLPGDSATFLVMSLEPVWRSDPELGGVNEDWPAYLQRAFVHEMTHARQLVAWAPLLRVAAGRVGLVDVDDDVIQQQFDTVPGVRASVRQETALLFQSAETESPTARRDLVRRALDLMRERRTRTYGTADAPWARVEQLLLDMEGAAQWAALAHVRRTERRLAPRAQRDLVRGSGQYWSQDQGLALYMALAALVPDWPVAMFSADPPSAVSLLEGALGTRDR